MTQGPQFLRRVARECGFCFACMEGRLELGKIAQATALTRGARCSAEAG